MGHLCLKLLNWGLKIKPYLRQGLSLCLSSFCGEADGADKKASGKSPVALLIFFAKGTCVNNKWLKKMERARRPKAFLNN